MRGGTLSSARADRHLGFGVSRRADVAPGHLQPTNQTFRFTFSPLQAAGKRLVWWSDARASRLAPRGVHNGEPWFSLEAERRVTERL